MRMLHISDTHLDRNNTPNALGVTPAATLRSLLTDLEHLTDIDVMAVSGDIADDGSVEAYRSVRGIIGDFARDRGIPVLYSIGNHDERTGFTEVLGSGHLDPSGEDRAQTLMASEVGERAAVSLVDGWRLITLDSLVPGMAYGHIGRAQLDWLREVLTTPAPRGTVVILHHPPIALDNEFQQALGLANPIELADAIGGTDVRLILCGHFHLQLSGFLGAVPVWSTPGVVNRFDLTAPKNTARVVQGASATLVQLDSAGSPMFHTLHSRDPQAGQAVLELDEPQVRAVIDKLGLTK